MHKKFILLSFITLPFELPTQIAAFVELYYYRNNKIYNNIAFIILLQYQKFLSHKMLQDYSLTLYIADNAKHRRKFLVVRYNNMYIKSSIIQMSLDKNNRRH